jgi:hypothetical protein
MTFKPVWTPKPRTANRIESEFYPKAMAFIERLKQGKSKDYSPTLHVSKPAMPEWLAWAAYFRTVYGSEPVAMKMVRAGRAPSITMPTQWPELFDMDYVPPDRLPADRDPDKRQDPSPAERARVAAGFDALKRELASANLSMQNPHPLPEDRITRAPGAISEKFRPHVPPRTDWAPSPPLDASALAALPNGRPRR